MDLEASSGSFNSFQAVAPVMRASGHAGTAMDFSMRDDVSFRWRNEGIITPDDNLSFSKLFLMYIQQHSIYLLVPNPVF